MIKKKNIMAEIRCYAMVYEANEIKAINDELAKADMQIHVRQEVTLIHGAMDFLFPLVNIAMSDIMISVYSGVAGNAAYNALSFFFLQVYNKFHGKNNTKSNRVEKKAVNVHLSIGSNKLVLPVDMDFDKYKYTIDKYFETVRNMSLEEKNYTMYDESTDTIVRKTEQQLIREEYEKHRIKTSSKE